MHFNDYATPLGWSNSTNINVFYLFYLVFSVFYPFINVISFINIPGINFINLLYTFSFYIVLWFTSLKNKHESLLFFTLSRPSISKQIL